MTEPGRQLVIGGYAVLNIFVETGSEDQPIVDTPGIQVCTELVVVVFRKKVITYLNKLSLGVQTATF